ncbi:hypothetical protein OUHCRE19_39670 [Enterobacter asburiae]|uniref:hypothetical protein n=1 Tax=Citrobacter TaxID=544 RepID=UPI002576E114|nr:hypothetical protein [Citrobacter sp. Cf097]MDM3205237.1 hypothetical protein [Citrobacter sp. Cf097]
MKRDMPEKQDTVENDLSCEPVMQDDDKAARDTEFDEIMQTHGTVYTELSTQ